MKKILLFAGLAAAAFSSQAQYFVNDSCGGAYRLCTTVNFPLGKSTLSKTISNGVTLTCGSAEWRSVWFKMSGYLNGTAVVTINAIDSACGMQAEAFTGSCGALVPVAGACGTAAAGGTITLTWATTAGTLYRVVVNTPNTGTCRNGEVFDISVSSPDSGIVGSPTANFINFPDPPIGCDTSTNQSPTNACIEFTNTSIERGGTIEYYWDIDDGSGFVLDTTAAVGKKDTLCFSPQRKYDIRLKACNECQKDLPAGGTQDYCDIDLGSIHTQSVYAMKISPAIDTIDTSVCSGTPIAFIATAEMLPIPLIPPDVTTWKWRFWQPGCVGYVDTNKLCFVQSMQGDTLIILDTCVNKPEVAGPDTIWYTPCLDTNYLWVEMVASGNCAPDSTDMTIIMKEPLEVDAYDDTAYVCDGDTSDVLCARIVSDTTDYPPPYTYVWRDSNNVVVDSFTTPLSDICIPGINLVVIPNEYFGGPLPFFLKVYDGNGCVGYDTMIVHICKPIIDTLHIGNLADTTAACVPDTNAIVLCADYTIGAFCPGDSVMIIYTVRGKPPLTLTWAPTTGLSSELTSWATDSVTDTAWVQSRTITTDLTIQLILIDSLDCSDTLEVCIPVHEPPTLIPPDSTCITAVSDSLFIGVDGACPGSIFNWGAGIPGGRHNFLLVSIGAPDSIMWFDYTILDTNLINLQDTIFEFASIITDGSTGCIDTATLVFQFDTVLAVNIFPGDSSLCVNNPVTLTAQISPAGDTAGIIYTWFQADTLAGFTDTSAITILPGDTAEYKVIIFRGGCTDLDSVVISIVPEPAITSVTIVPDSICNTLTDTVDLVGVGSAAPNITYLWTSAPAADTIFDATALVTKAIISGITDFCLTITDTSVFPNCDTTACVTAYIFPPPVITSADSGFCEPDLPQTTTISVTGVSGGATFDWSITSAPFDTMIVGPTNASSITVAFDTTHGFGTYTFAVAVFDPATGCPDTLSYPFRIDSGVVTLTMASDTVCLGDPDTIFAIGASIFVWSSVPASVINCLTPPICDTVQVIPTVNTTYTAIGTSGQCKDTQSVSITVIPLSVNAGPSFTICQGTSASLNATTSGGTRLWTDNGMNGTFSSTTVEDPVYTPHPDSAGMAIKLTLFVTDVTGFCGTIEDSTFVTVDSLPQILTIAATPDTMCSGDTLSLDITTLASTTYSWSDGAALGTFIPTITTKSPDYTYGVFSSQTITFIVTATGSPVCPADLDTVTAFLIGLLSVDAGLGSTICQGTTATLNSTVSGGRWVWNDNGNNGTFSDSLAADPTYTPHPDSVGMAMMLTLTVTDTFGYCGSASDSVFIAIDSFPVINSISALPDSSCSGDTLALSGTTTSASVYLWTDGGAGGTFIPGSASLSTGYVLVTAVPTTVTFILTATGSAVCPSDLDTVSAYISYVPVADAGGPAYGPICQGDTLVLAGSHVGDSIIWTHDGAGTLLNPLTDAPVYISTTGDLGTVTFIALVTTQICGTDADTATLTVNVKPVVGMTGNDSVFCIGDCATLTASGAATYRWYSLDASGSPVFITTTTSPVDSIVECPTDTTTYMVIGENGFACADTAFFTVNIVPNDPPVGWEPTYEIDKCYPLEVTLAYTPPSTVSAWSWDMGDGTVITSLTSATHTYIGNADSTYPVVYTVDFSITHTYGAYTCPNGATMQIEVCEDFKIPNAFTPNGDGKNDAFYISGAEELDGCELMIFNRWGVMVFKSDNYQNDWEGTDTNGNKLKSDTFYFVFRCGNESTHTGWVKILND